jgi:hypothetical protein
VNPQDPLANLHPLRVPEAIGWWPPALGWWLLLFAAIVLLATIAYLLYRRHQRNAYRRLALRQLKTLYADYLVQLDAGHYLGQLNGLLKSVALLAYPRPLVAAQHGEHWRAFLNSTLPPGEQLPAAFDEAPYQQTCPQIDVMQVHRAARSWIQRHRAMS